MSFRESDNDHLESRILVFSGHKNLQTFLLPVSKFLHVQLPDDLSLSFFRQRATRQALCHWACVIHHSAGKVKSRSLDLGDWCFRVP